MISMYRIARTMNFLRLGVHWAPDAPSSRSRSDTIPVPISIFRFHEISRAGLASSRPRLALWFHTHWPHCIGQKGANSISLGRLIRWLAWLTVAGTKESTRCWGDLGWNRSSFPTSSTGANTAMVLQSARGTAPRRPSHFSHFVLEIPTRNARRGSCCILQCTSAALPVTISKFLIILSTWNAGQALRRFVHHRTFPWTICSLWQRRFGLWNCQALPTGLFWFQWRCTQHLMCYFWNQILCRTFTIQSHFQFFHVFKTGYLPMWPILFTAEIKNRIPEVAGHVETHGMKMPAGTRVFGTPRCKCQVVWWFDDRRRLT